MMTDAWTNELANMLIKLSRAPGKPSRLDWTGLMKCRDAPHLLKKGVTVLCEWQEGQYHKAKVVRRSKKNWVVLLFHKEDMTRCVRFRGLPHTPKNRPKVMYFNPNNEYSIV